MHMGLCASGAVSDVLAEVRAGLDEICTKTPARDLRYGIVEEQICFDSFHRSPAYVRLANAVSNDWQTVLANLSQTATNNVERLFVLCVSLQYDENFYLDFCSTLCDMRANNAITARELESAMASRRYDIDTCLIRRYQEPKVVALVNKLKIAMPQQESRWNDILSGAAYTNYLEEVAIGLWQ